jgi:prepilin-type processing-associated H-X9-DG protein
MVNGKSYFQMIWDDYQGTQRLAKAGMKSIFICPSANDAGSLFPTEATNIKLGYFNLHGQETPTNSQQITTSSTLAGKNYFPFSANYCYNSKLLSSITPSALYDGAALKMSMLRPGSEVVVMTEKLNNPGEYKIEDVQNYNNKYPGAYLGSSGPSISANGYISNIAQSKADWRRFTTRHKKGGNLLFADGHVAHFSWLEAQIQPSQMPGGYGKNTSDANQPGKMIWSIVGPVN